MTRPTLTMYRQLYRDLVRAAFAAEAGEPLEWQPVVASGAVALADPDGGADSHGHNHSGEHGHSHGCNSVEGDYMLGLHIAAIFIILAASAVGTLIPIVGKRVPALRLHAYVYAVGKAAATGVVLAVAMIHMINHAAT
ncbi:hypothetical protein IOCL2690_000043200, partial [Leishmania lindenbergi]